MDDVAAAGAGAVSENVDIAGAATADGARWDFARLCDLGTDKTGRRALVREPVPDD